MFSVHMFSKRTIPASCVNEQGKLDRHLSDGATALYRTGHEYDGVFPVWNWTRPPGTTTATAAVRAPTSRTDPANSQILFNDLSDLNSLVFGQALPACGNAKHTTAAVFVGSATDGTHGVAMHMQRLESATAADSSRRLSLDGERIFVRNCSAGASSSGLSMLVAHLRRDFDMRAGELRSFLTVAGGVTSPDNPEICCLRSCGPCGGGRLQPADGRS